MHFRSLSWQTNRTLTIQTHYIHSFANVFTGVQTNGNIELFQLTSIPTNRSRKIDVQLETLAITNAPWLPIDLLLISP
jgi:hypothetical protein